MNEPLKIKVSSAGLAEWLTSNRVGNPYDARTPVIGFRDDITCPKSGERIPLDKFSCKKWSDSLWLIHCPACGVSHGFTPVHSEQGKER